MRYLAAEVSTELLALITAIIRHTSYHFDGVVSLVTNKLGLPAWLTDGNRPVCRDVFHVRSYGRQRH